MNAGRNLIKRHPLLRYGIAVLSVALALVVNLGLGPVIRPTPTPLFFMAVMVSAWSGGLAPGLVATVLSTLAINYYFIPPYYSFGIVGPGALLRLGVFVVAALLISGLNQSRRSALGREQQQRAVSQAAQQEAEAAKERLETVLSSISDGFYTLDRDWHFTYVNERVCEMAGKSREELLGYRSWDVFPEVVNTVAYTKMHQAMRDRTVVEFEYWHSAQNRCFEHRVYPSPHGLTVFLAEITDRRQAEAALHQSEERFRQLADVMPQIVWIADAAGSPEYVSRRWVEYTGLTLEQTADQNWIAQVIHPDDLEPTYEIWRRCLETGSLYQTEFRLKQASAGQSGEQPEERSEEQLDQTYRWFLCRAVPIHNPQGQITHWYGTLTDLHERKQVEAALRESQALFESFMRYSPAAAYIKDQDGRYLYLNSLAEQICQVPLADLQGKTDFDFFPWAAAQQWREHDLAALASGTAIEVEETIPLADGEHALLSFKFPIPQASGRQLIGGMSLDVTERRRTEAALQQSEVQLRLAVEGANLGLWHWDVQSDTLTWTDQCKALFGLPADAEISYQVFLNRLHPEDRQRIEAMRPVLEDGQLGRHEIEYRVVWPDDTVHWIAARGQATYDADGRPISSMGIVLDITERKRVEDERRQAEAALQQRETELRLVTNAIPALVSFVDADQRYRFNNRAYEEWFGHPAAAIYGKTLQEVLGESAYEALRPYVERVLAGEQVSYESLIPYKDGGHRYISATYVPRFDAQGRVEGFVALVNDINDRKQAEIALVAQEQRYRYIFEAVGISIWEQDFSEVKAAIDQLKAAGVEDFQQYFSQHPEFVQQAIGMVRLRDVNQATLQLYGAQSKAELLGSLHQIFTPETHTAFVGELLTLAAAESHFMSETVAQTLQGDRFHILFTITFPPLTESYDRVLVSVLDITERKQAEQALRVAEERLRIALQNAPIIMFNQDRDLKYTWIQNPALYDLDEMLGKHDRDYLPSEDAERLTAIKQKVLETEIGTREAVKLTRDEIDYYYDLTVEPLRDDSHTTIGITCAAIDVSELKRTEFSLRESEARFRGVVESNMVGIFFWNASGHITDGNGMAVEMLGYSREELQSGQVQWQDITPSEFQQIDLAMQTQLLTEGVCPPFEKAYFRKDGTQVPVLIGGALLPGYSDCGVAYFIDITDRKRRERNAEFLVSISRDLTRSISMEELFQSLGQEMCRYFDFSILTFSELNDTADRAQVIYNSRDLEIKDAIGEHRLADYLSDHQIEQLKAGRVVAIDDVSTLEIPGNDAAYQPFQVRSILIAPYLSDGRLQFILSGSRRIPSHWRKDEMELVQELATRIWIRIERARAEVALRENEDRLRIAIESAELGTWDWNLMSNELVCDTGWRTMFGLSPDAQTSIEIFYRGLHPDERDRVYEIVQQSLNPESGGRYDAEYRTVGIEDGIERWIAAKGQAYFNAAGEAVRFIGTVLDVTDRIQVECDRERILQQEQTAREAAEAANRIKDEFLAVVSHELRSPLNPILGWAKLLRGRQLDEQKADRALEVIERNAQMQAQLINDLLDVSRILRGKLSLDTQPVDLAATIQAAMETVRLAAEAKSIQINTQLDPDVGRVAGDSGRLQQVIWNLLSNAVKFTSEEGRVDIRLEQMDSQAQITVSDTGKGIAADFLPYVFEQFRQESSATTRRFGGLGLGLAIVRYLVELHGGTIQVDSPGEGQGASFTVTLPLMPDQPLIDPDTLPAAEPTQNLQGIRILVVDDDANTREFLAFLLELYRANVIAVAAANEALTVLTQFKPDVLLSDVGMPDVDGYMLVRQIRSLPAEQGGQIPAIALTAYAGEIDYRQAMAAGFQKHLSKPVEPEILVRAIATLVNSS